jgi:glycosyltransferase involved in cell wall biosynthesis
LSETWNVLAHLRAELGIGEIARRLLSLLRASGIRVNPVDFELTRSRRGQAILNANEELEINGNLITCVNPDQLAAAIALHSVTSVSFKKHTGFWAWELEDSPRVFGNAADLLDEVWTISNFSKASLDKVIKRPSKVVSVPVPFPLTKTNLRRSDFGIPENRFLVTTSFDYMSDVRRKNPRAAIEAYKQAFKEKDHATLVVKSINAPAFPELESELMETAAGREDIVFLDKYLSAYENNALLELSDVFLSLHRSEGYGINLADSIARETAVIATGYSGNTDFMEESSSVLVPFELVPVKKYAGLRINSKWAEPDVAFAASNLRVLLDNPDKLKRMQLGAYKSLKERHSLRPAVKNFAREFINE